MLGIATKKEMKQKIGKIYDITNLHDIAILDNKNRTYSLLEMYKKLDEKYNALERRIESMSIETRLNLLEEDVISAERVITMIKGGLRNETKTKKRQATRKK